MSTFAIDSARTNERLSAFKAEIGASEPIDNYFPKIPALNLFMDSKKTQDGGRQIIYPIDSGYNQTIKDFSDYDTFDTSGQDTALTVGYPMVNKGGTITISWEEMREIAGNDHRIFDLVKHKRDNALKTIMNQLCTDMFQTSQSALKITSLAVAIDSTGSTGNLSQSTDSDWASTETASGSFATQGRSDMRTLWNTLADNGSEPNFIITTPTVYQYYENDVDPDVRYNVAVQGQQKLTANRGFVGGVMFNSTMITRDLKCNSGVMYMGNSDNLFFIVDTEGNFDIDDFITPSNQKVSTAKIVFRGNLICNRRKSHGKLTGISA